MVDFNKDLILKDPENWMTLETAMNYVSEKYNRHWSKSYIYTLMRKNQLNSYKLGILLSREEVDHVVNNFKRMSPPIMRKVEENEDSQEKPEKSELKGDVSMQSIQN